MLIVLSPSKTLNFDPRPRVKTSTEPMFLDQAETLIDKLRKFSKPRLAELMGISDKLAAENWQRYRDWQPGSNPPGAKQAALAFRGDVYDGLQADKWKAADFKFAQPRLRILSGLYGVLRPLDLMQPYRLEMGTPLKIGRADNLYQFWGTQITHALNEDLAAAKTGVLVNLASKEYFDAVRPEALDAEIVTPVFKEERDGKFRFMSFYGKKARGLMADFIIRHRLKKPEQIREFDTEGYRYNEAQSSEREWAFTRKS